jgi:hypothetical protein
MKPIYISRNGNQEGPFSEQQIKALLATHEVSRDDFAWQEGMEDWQPLSHILTKPQAETLEDFVPDSFKINDPLRYKMDEIDGSLSVYDDYLTITPKGILGLLNKGLKGTKTIPFHSITAIQFKQAGLTKGYLQFTIPGGNESRGGVLDAVTDENTFLFDGSGNYHAETIKKYIETRMREIRTPKSVASSSLSDELSKLAVR